jgi:hypothetical protein
MTLGMSLLILILHICTLHGVDVHSLGVRCVDICSAGTVWVGTTWTCLKRLFRKRDFSSALKMLIFDAFQEKNTSFFLSLYHFIQSQRRLLIENLTTTLRHRYHLNPLLVLMSSVMEP